MGAGAWPTTPEARRGPIEAAIVKVQGWGRALFSEPAPLADFGAQPMPVLLMEGQDFPASARAVTRLLSQTLPRLETLKFEELGHMGLVTHSEVVNSSIEDFLRRHAATCDPERRMP